MSGKEKDASYREAKIIKVTCGNDEDQMPVIEEKWAVPRVPDFHLWSSEAVILPDFLLGHQSGVVSEVDSIGRDIQTERLITIGDAERCGGLYMLGQPRTGKSNLLVSLALSDIRRNHGILFIDPHTDAINDLLGRIPENRREDIVLLDPTDKQHSFGINLLHCRDQADGIELDNACGRVRDVFVKVWGDDRGQLGVWLNKIIKNAVYLLLENPGYTLYDLPPLLWEDATFRNELLKNVTVKTGVKDFWYNEFDRLTKRERTEQVEPALSRLDIFRNNDMVRDIVSQVKSTIDFGQLLRERKIVLLRLPVNLTGEVKTLIGTIVLSEVLYAVFEREKLPKSQREYFGIFCDEFQEFATPDFARLFTQSGKYKVMPVVAHQTRLGQFKPGDPNQGATLTSPNKVLFTLSSHDARELALEFAEEPPTETKLEREPGISTEPVFHLLRFVHKNELIAKFVEEYLRPLEEKREDAKEDIEGKRIERMIALDEAAMGRLEEGLLALEMDDSPTRLARQHAYRRAQSGLSLAKVKAYQMLSLFKSSKEARLTVRRINAFLTDIMRGTIAPYQEKFSDFLIERVSDSPLVTDAYRPLAALYIRLTYGEPNSWREIPVWLAKAEGLFSEAVVKAEREAAERKQREIEERIREELDLLEMSYKESLEYRRQRKPTRAECMAVQLSRKRFLFYDYFGGPGGGGRSFDFGHEEHHNGARVDQLLATYVLLFTYDRVAKVLEPYYTARLKGAWATELPETSKISMIIDALRVMKRVNGRAWNYKKVYDRRQMLLYRLMTGRIHETEEYLLTYSGTNIHDDIIDAFEAFLHRYGQGAIVALLLIKAAKKPTCWWGGPGNPEDLRWDWFNMRDKDSNFVYRNGMMYEAEEYQGYSMKHVPALVNHEPLAVLLTLDRLNELMQGLPIEAECAKYYWMGSDEDPYEALRKEGKFPPWRFDILPRKSKGQSGQFVKELKRDRDDLVLLRKKLERMPERSRLLALSRQNELIEVYLQRRACDIARYSEAIADLTFPQPTIPGASAGQVAEIVRVMAQVLEDMDRPAEEAKRREFLRECEAAREAIRNAPVVVQVSENLGPRVLSARERNVLISACLRECEKYEPVKVVLQVVRQFSEFCECLGQPENHIKVPGLYVEKSVRQRQEADMVNEMARVLTALPRYTAYARVVEEERGESGVWKGRIRTAKLTAVQEDAAAETRRSVLTRRENYCRPRRDIQDEIDRRRKEWVTPQAQTEASPGRMEEKRPSRNFDAKSDAKKILQDQ